MTLLPRAQDRQGVDHTGQLSSSSPGPCLIQLPSSCKSGFKTVSKQSRPPWGSAPCSCLVPVFLASFLHLRLALGDCPVGLVTAAFSPPPSEELSVKVGPEPCLVPSCPPLLSSLTRPTLRRERICSRFSASADIPVGRPLRVRRVCPAQSLWREEARRRRRPFINTLHRNLPWS